MGLRWRQAALCVLCIGVALSGLLASSQAVSVDYR